MWVASLDEREWPEMAGESQGVIRALATANIPSNQQFSPSTDDDDRHQSSDPSGCSGCGSSPLFSSHSHTSPSPTSSSNMPPTQTQLRGTTFASSSTTPPSDSVQYGA